MDIIRCFNVVSLLKTFIIVTIISLWTNVLTEAGPIRLNKETRVEDLKAEVGPMKEANDRVIQMVQNKKYKVNETNQSRYDEKGNYLRDKHNDFVVNRPKAFESAKDNEPVGKNTKEVLRKVPKFQKFPIDNTDVDGSERKVLKNGLLFKKAKGEAEEHGRDDDRGLKDKLSLRDVELPDHVDGVRLEHDGHLNPHYKKEILLGEEHNEFATAENERHLPDRLKVVFKKADIDHDGYLVRSELESWIMDKVLEHLDEAVKENDRVFHHLDTNKDELVSWREFRTHFLLAKGKDLKKIERYTDDNDDAVLNLDIDDKETILRYKFRWSEADKSPQDNQLNREEMKNFRHPEQSPLLIARMAKDVIDNLDENGDGVITEEEFVEMPRGGGVDDLLNAAGGYARDETSLINDRRKEFRNVIDQNHDGKVDEQELKVYVDPHNIQHAQLEASNLLELADENSDGKLSLEEVLNNADVFFGSKIMNVAINFHDEF